MDQTGHQRTYDWNSCRKTAFNFDRVLPLNLRIEYSSNCPKQQKMGPTLSKPLILGWDNIQYASTMDKERLLLAERSLWGNLYCLVNNFISQARSVLCATRSFYNKVLSRSILGISWQIPIRICELMNRISYSFDVLCHARAGAIAATGQLWKELGSEWG